MEHMDEEWEKRKFDASLLQRGVNLESISA
jgi:hypothetical protein